MSLTGKMQDWNIQTVHDLGGQEKKEISYPHPMWEHGEKRPPGEKEVSRNQC